MSSVKLDFFWGCPYSLLRHASKALPSDCSALHAPKAPKVCWVVTGQQLSWLWAPLLLLFPVFHPSLWLFCPGEKHGFICNIPSHPALIWYVWVLACMCIFALHVCSAYRGQRKGIRPPGLEVTDGCELPYMPSRIAAKDFNRLVISPSFIDFVFFNYLTKWSNIDRKRVSGYFIYLFYFLLLVFETGFLC